MTCWRYQWENNFPGEYAEGLKARLRAAAPNAVVEERFLGPQDLAHIFAATALNVHPPVYDAYGMTVVEAASQGDQMNPAALCVCIDMLVNRGASAFIEPKLLAEFLADGRRLKELEAERCSDDVA